MAWVFAGLLLGSAGPVAAQIRSAGDDNPVAPSGITTVSPVSGRGWRLTASVATLYDDNILRIGNGLAIPANEYRSDFRISPAASASVGLPFGRQQFYLGGLIGRDLYGRNKILNRNRYLIGGGLNWRVGTSCTGTIAGEFRRRQNLLSEASVLVDNVQETRVYGATGNCQAPVGLGFGGHIIRTEIDNLNPLRRLFNAQTTVFGPSLSYGSPGIGRLSLSGDVQAVRYPDRTVQTPDANNALVSATDGTNIYSVRAGYQRSLGTRLTLNLGASYLKVQPKPRATLQPIAPGPPILFGIANRNGYSGGGYDAAITYSPSSRLSAQFNASRNITSSPNVGASFIIAQQYGVDTSYEVGPSITAGLGATLDRRAYRGSFTSVLEPLARVSDDTSRVYARLTYAPVRLYTLDFQVAHQQRNSNPAFYSYKSNSATLTLRLLFGRG